MKTTRTACLFIFLLVACGRIAAADPVQRPLLRPAQIEELVSPIALYPDPLVALILPAATRPSDIVLAARFLERGGDLEQAAAEPWDDSVKALARYREVITYLDENLAWTRSLGECFLDQPKDVMDAIQMVRVRARAAGLLTDTSEQAIVVESDEICIVPANPTVIYVPRYDPEILYVYPFPIYYHGPFLSFSVGYSVGAWLSYDCDWHYRSVCVVQRPAAWYHQPDWRRHHHDEPFGGTAWTRWTPPPRHDRRFDRPSHTAELVLRPDRPRNLTGRTHDAEPDSHRRDEDRPSVAPNPFHFEPQHGRDGANPSRNDRTNQRREQAATISPQVAVPTPSAPRFNQPPSGFQGPRPEAPAERVRNNYPDAPRQDHGGRPSVSAPPTYAPPAPAVRTPPPDRSQPAIAPRPPEPRTESRERPDQPRRDDANDRRRQQD